MKDLRKELIEYKEKAEKLVDLCIIDDDNAVIMCKAFSNDLKVVYVNFIDDSKELKDMGVEVPVDILLGQLKRFINAVEVEDTIALSDVLAFEVLDTFDIYLEIQNELFGNL